MTLQQFLKDFYCKVDIQNQGNVNLVITIEAIRRANNHVVDRVKHQLTFTKQMIG